MSKKALLLKENGEIIGFTIKGKTFYIDESGTAEAQVSDLKGIDMGSIPYGIWLRPLKGNEIIVDGVISRTKRYDGIAMMEIYIYRKYWEHKFGASHYLGAMKKAIQGRKKSVNDVKFIEIQNDDPHMFLRYEIFLSEDMPVNEALKRFQEVVQEIEGHAERILENVEISSDTLTDERKYVTEVLLPLFRSMDFMDVRYNHGNREFGKDITFSEIDKFGVKRNYGVQVKIGNLSGEAGSELDKILGQIEDAFYMPYVETTSMERKYISDFIIAISGRFTGNAKEKIIEKLKRHNVYFLDIDKTHELLAKYMKKSIRD